MNDIDPPTEIAPLQPKKSSFWRCVYRSALLLFALGLSVTAYLVWDMWTFLHSPAENVGREVQISIEPGTSFAQISRDLYVKGLLRDPARFRLYVGWRNQLGALQAGEFMANSSWTPPQLLEHLISGQSIQYKLVLREGLTWWEVADLIEQAGFATAKDVKAVLHDPDFLAANHIPFENAEGFLYPETYQLLKPRKLDRKAAETVVTALIDMFWKKTAHLWREEAERVKQLETQAAANQTRMHPLYATAAITALHRPWVPYPGLEGLPIADFQRLLILASLVERETGLPVERPRVAGVYTNRMRIGMLLQCDPTIIYGLGDRFTGNLTRLHLQDKLNKYNTYQHVGLPPGPICSPGQASLAAAVVPEEHKYLYFVAKGAGLDHYFSKNLTEHNQAVQKYQIRRR